MSHPRTILLFILVLGSQKDMFGYISCSNGPVNNQEQSYLTISSIPGLMFGVIGIVGEHVS